MKSILVSEFHTKDGVLGTIITRKRTDGCYISTFKPELGLSFHSIDANCKQSHETVKSFLRDIKGCLIVGEVVDPNPPQKPAFYFLIPFIKKILKFRNFCLSSVA